jgi:hypothetical protein
MARIKHRTPSCPIPLNAAQMRAMQGHLERTVHQSSISLPPFIGAATITEVPIACHAAVLTEVMLRERIPEVSPPQFHRWLRSHALANARVTFL